MSRIPDAFIDALIARSDIVDVVGSRVPLKKAGHEYQACCPFHDEKTPSFTVSPKKQFYHCFGCGAHGTVIGFLMNYDRLEFLDAIEELAKRAGMEVPRETRQRERNPEIDDLYAVLKQAADYYVHQLAHHAVAKQYIDGRGIDANIQQKFAIGYAPEGWSHLKDELMRLGHSEKHLHTTGMLSKNDRNHTYDKFRHRLMFPIHDRRGRPIAFGGRIINPEDKPKYLNSPETPLFHKGRELYGLYQARQEKVKPDYLIVVEGYMDVIGMAQHGQNGGVATLGTATTQDHAELLFRQANKVVFCFDGDRAGRDAAWRACKATLPRMRDGRQAAFCFLPDGHDPDTLIAQEGLASFQERLNAATDLADFYFAHQAQGLNLDAMSQRASLAEKCQPDLQQMPDGALRELMHNQLQDMTGLSRSTTKPKPKSNTANQRTQPHVRHHSASNQRSLVRTMITMLLNQPALAMHCPLPATFASLDQPGIPLLIDLIQSIQSTPTESSAILIERFNDHPHHDALMQLLIAPSTHMEDMAAEFLGGIKQLEKQTLEQHIQTLLMLQREGQLDARGTEALRLALQKKLES